jgi:hypothetical protein
MKPVLAALAVFAAGMAVILQFAQGDVSRAEGPAGWGTIRGRIVWDGATVPAQKPLDITVKNCLANGPVLNEELVVNQTNKGIKNVLIWLLPQRKGEKVPVNPTLAKPPAQPVVLDQPRCQFFPHVLGVREGQDLLVKNSAAIAHNVNWAGDPLKNPGGNQLLPAGGSYTITGLRAQRLPMQVKCNIHPWMSAWVGIYDHPYFAVTDSDGKFEIKLAPAGQYPLMIWQEKIGYRGGAKGRNGTPINIKTDGVTDLGELGMKSD